MTGQQEAISHLRILEILRECNITDEECINLLRRVLLSERDQRIEKRFRNASPRNLLNLQRPQRLPNRHEIAVSLMVVGLLEFIENHGWAMVGSRTKSKIEQLQDEIDNLHAALGDVERRLKEPEPEIKQLEIPTEALGQVAAPQDKTDLENLKTKYETAIALKQKELGEAIAAEQRIESVAAMAKVHQEIAQLKEELVTIGEQQKKVAARLKQLNKEAEPHLRFLYPEQQKKLISQPTGLNPGVAAIHKSESTESAASEYIFFKKEPLPTS